jgi:cell division protease FtsH
MVGADLRNLVNEAALSAARREQKKIELSDFTNSLERIILGAERRITISADERERTAYHESGHALLGMLEPGADPVRKVSIVPRGRAARRDLPVARRRPLRLRRALPQGPHHRRARRPRGRGDRLRQRHDRRGVRPRAGHADRAPDGRALGHVRRDRHGLGPPRPYRRPGLLPRHRRRALDATRELVDSEVRKIIDECYVAAVERLNEHRDQLETLTKELLEHETLDEDDAYRAAGFDRPPAALHAGPEPHDPPGLEDTVRTADIRPTDP